MSRGQRGLLDQLGDATSSAGSEAMAAISNLGGGDAGGTVGRLVSAVAGSHGGFAPKVITSVTKHGIAGIDRVEPLPEVDRGYRAVAGDANGLESIRTIIELDPREYDVTVTREEGAGVVEFVQQPKPEPQPAIEPAPPVKRDGVAGGTAASVEPAPRSSGESVEQAREEARKARAEAEAEKARAEAETARAEAEAAKARAEAEQARAEGEIERARGGGQSRTTELDGGTSVPAASPNAAGPEHTDPSPTIPAAAGLPPGAGGTADCDVEDPDRSLDAGDVDPAFATGRVTASEASTEEPRESLGDAGRWSTAESTEPVDDSTDTQRLGVSGAAGTASVEDDGNAVGDTAASTADAVTTTVDDADGTLRTDRPLSTQTVESGETGEPTVVDDTFGSFVAAEPVDGAPGDDGSAPASEAATTGGIGNWAGTDGESDDAPSDDETAGETGGFEF
ncbi:hypothetical protein JCM30237_16590 [Halolamina litorea]|uniref:Uncharacterized protein n=1 Tax=Halolamina litorea TaxID=1515593 RepID=A0ABD6BTL0_9EURY|nr:hypothetical protein [Halolamina litorea]